MKYFCIVCSMARRFLFMSMLPVLAGCTETLIFFEQTAFKLGISVNEEPPVPLEVTVGLKRRVIAISPPKQPLREDTTGSRRPDGEAVSLLSRFDVIYHPDPSTDTQAPGNPLAGKLQIISAFASGEAAITIASHVAATAAIMEPQSVEKIISTFRPDLPPTPTPLPRTSTINAISDTERNLSLDGAKAVQAALCIENLDGNFGGEGSETREAIRQYQTAKGHEVTGILETRAGAELVFVPKCPPVFENAYERFTLGSGPTYVQLNQDVVRQLQEDLEVPPTGAMDDETRKGIRQLEKKLLLPETGELTPAVDEATAAD